MTTPLASLETAKEDGRVVIRVSGEIDLSNAFTLGQGMEEAIANASTVTIDLTEVSYIDSQGVRVLYQLSRRANAEGIELTFIAPAGSIAGQVLELTRISDIVPVRELPET